MKGSKKHIKRSLVFLLLLVMALNSFIPAAISEPGTNESQTRTEQQIIVTEPDPAENNDEAEPPTQNTLTSSPWKLPDILTDQLTGNTDETGDEGDDPDAPPPGDDLLDPDDTGDPDGGDQLIQGAAGDLETELPAADVSTLQSIMSDPVLTITQKPDPVFSTDHVTLEAELSFEATAPTRVQGLYVLIPIGNGTYTPGEGEFIEGTGDEPNCIKLPIDAFDLIPEEGGEPAQVTVRKSVRFVPFPDPIPTGGDTLTTQAEVYLATSGEPDEMINEASESISINGEADEHHLMDVDFYMDEASIQTGLTATGLIYVAFNSITETNFTDVELKIPMSASEAESFLITGGSSKIQNYYYDEAGYMVLRLKPVTLPKDEPTVEISFSVTPFENGITPNGTEFTTHVEASCKAGGTTYSEITEDSTVTAIAKFDWNALSKTPSRVGIGGVYIGDESYDSANPGSPAIRYTIRANSNNHDEYGRLYAETLTVTDTLTLPNGASCNINAIADYIDVSGDDNYTVTIEGAAPDYGDGNHGSFVITWTKKNDEPIVQELGGGSFAESVTLKKIDFSDAFFENFDSETGGYPIISNTIAGSVDPAGNGAADDISLYDGAELKDVNVTIQVSPARPDVETVEEEFEDITKGADRKIVIGNDAFSWTINVPGNPVNAILNNFIITDEGWDEPFTPSSVRIPAARNAIGQTVTVHFYGEDDSDLGSGTCSQESGGTVSVPAGTKKITMDYDDVGPGFELAGAIAIQGSFPETRFGEMENGLSYENGASVSFAYDQYPDDGEPATTISRSADEASVVWKKQNTDLTKDAWGDENVQPGQTIDYTVVIYNYNTNKSLTPMYFTDTWSPYFETNPVVSLVGSDFEVHQLVSHVDADGNVSYSMGADITAENNLQYNSTTQNGDGGSATVNYKGSLPPMSAIVVHYQIKLKDIDGIAKALVDDPSNIPDGWETADWNNGKFDEFNLDAAYAYLASGSASLKISNGASSPYGDGYINRYYDPNPLNDGQYYVEMEKTASHPAGSSGAFTPNDAVVFEISYQVMCPEGEAVFGNEATVGEEGNEVTLPNDVFTLTDTLPAGMTFDEDSLVGATFLPDQSDLTSDPQILVFEVSLPRGADSATGAVTFEAVLPPYNPEEASNYYPKMSNRFRNKVSLDYLDGHYGYSLNEGTNTTYDPDNGLLITYADLDVSRIAATVQVSKSSVSRNQSGNFLPGEVVYYSFSLKNTSNTDVTLSKAVDLLPPYVEFYLDAAKDPDSVPTAYGAGGMITLSSLPDNGATGKIIFGLNGEGVTLNPGEGVTINFAAKISDVPFNDYSDTEADLTNRAGFLIPFGEGEVAVSGGFIDDKHDYDGVEGADQFIFAEDTISVEQKSIRPGIYKAAVTRQTGSLTELSDSAILVPESLIEWTVVVLNQNVAHVSKEMVGFKVVETLPEGFTYYEDNDHKPTAQLVPASSGSGALNASGNSVLGSGLTINASTGSDNFTISADALTVNPGQAVRITFWTMAPDRYGQFTNNAVLYPKEQFYPTARHKQNPGTYVVTDQGEGLSATDSVSILGSASLKAVKTVSYNGNSASSGGVLTVPPGAEVEYTLTLTNNGKRPISGIVFIDRLPEYGDKSVITGQRRYSAFAPVYVDGSAHGGTVMFSEKTTFDRDSDFNGSTSDWHDGYSSDDQSIRFDLGTATLAAGKSVSVSFKATVPDDAPALSPAWNSFAVQATVTTRDFTIEPAKVGVQTIYSRLGDYVWLDQNGNSIQDKGEPGIEGVVVELYLKDELDVQGDAAKPLRTTTTNNNGYYEFNRLPAGNYVVVFPKAVKVGGIDCGLVLKDEGFSDLVDSDADPDTGKTAAITLGEGEVNLTVDAGYIPPAGLGSLEFTKRVEGFTDGLWPQGLAFTFTITGPEGHEEEDYYLDEEEFTLSEKDVLTQPYATRIFNGLVPGRYTITEVGQDGDTDGHTLILKSNDGVAVVDVVANETATEQATVQASITNTYKLLRGGLMITKQVKTKEYDGTNEPSHLADGYETYWPKDYNPEFKVVSVDNGAVRWLSLGDYKPGDATRSGSLSDLPAGEYRITEENAGRDGYTHDDLTMTILVEGNNEPLVEKDGSFLVTVIGGEDETVHVTATNAYTRDLGNLEFEKSVVTVDLNRAQAVQEEWPEGLVLRFRIEGPDDFAAREFELNGNPNVSMAWSLIPTGEYTITEITEGLTPPNYYKLVSIVPASDSAVVEKGEAGEKIAKTSIVNTFRKLGDLTFTKTVKVTDAYENMIDWPKDLSLTFTINGPSDCVWSEIVSKNLGKGLAVSGANGKITLNGDRPSIELINLPTGSYTITEDNATKTGYTLVVTDSATQRPDVTFATMANAEMHNAYTRDVGKLTFTKDLIMYGLDAKNSVANLGWQEGVEIQFTISGPTGNLTETGLTNNNDCDWTVFEAQAVSGTDVTPYSTAYQFNGVKYGTATFTLSKNYPSIVFDGLPSGTYTITENRTDGIKGIPSEFEWVSTSTNPVKPNVGKGSSATGKITNTYREMGNLEFTKNVETKYDFNHDLDNVNWPKDASGKDIPISFTITGPAQCNWTTIKNANTAAGLTVSGSSATFTLDSEKKFINLHLPTGTYTIKENADSAKREGFTWSVTSNDGKTDIDGGTVDVLVTKSTTEKPVTVTPSMHNTYTRDYGSLTFTKTVQVTDAENGVVSTKSNTPDSPEVWPDGLVLKFSIEGPTPLKDCDWAKVVTEPGDNKLITFDNTTGKATFTLDKTHQSIKLNNLPTGSYKITELTGDSEILIPEGYVLTSGSGLSDTKVVSKNANIAAGITNKLRAVGNLDFEKTVEWVHAHYQDWNDETEWALTFTITGPSDCNWASIATQNPLAGLTASSGSAKFTLSNTKTGVELLKIPTGKYTITEDLAGGKREGYTLTVLDNDPASGNNADGKAENIVVRSEPGHPNTVEMTMDNTYTRDLGALKFTKDLVRKGLDSAGILQENLGWPDGMTIQFTISGPVDSQGKVVNDCDWNKYASGLSAYKFTVVDDASGKHATFTLSSDYQDIEFLNLPTGTYTITEGKAENVPAGFTQTSSTGPSAQALVEKGLEATPSITNIYREYGNLSFEKSVVTVTPHLGEEDTDDKWPEGLALEFTIIADDPNMLDEEWLAYRESDPSNPIIFVDGQATFSLNSDEKGIVLRNLPTGTYTISEVGESAERYGYSLKVTDRVNDDGSGQELVDGILSGILVKNHKDTGITTETGMTDTYTRQYGNLEFTKDAIVDEAGDDEDQDGWPDAPTDWGEITFTISGPEGFDDWDWSKYVQEGVTATNPSEATFTLSSDNPTIRLENLPKGWYTIKENTDEAKLFGYTWSVSNTGLNGEDEIEIQDEQVTEITVSGMTNAYTRDHGDLTFAKTVVINGVDGRVRDWPDDLTLTFKISGPSEEHLDECDWDDVDGITWDGESDTATFTLNSGNRSVTLEGLPTGTYTITEDASTTDLVGYTLSSVTNNNGVQDATGGVIEGVVVRVDENGASATPQITMTNTYTRDFSSMMFTKNVTIRDQGATPTDTGWPEGLPIKFSISGPQGVDDTWLWKDYTGWPDGIKPEVNNENIAFFTLDFQHQSIELSGLPTGVYTITEIPENLDDYALTTEGFWDEAITHKFVVDPPTGDSDTVLIVAVAKDYVPVAGFNNLYNRRYGALTFNKRVEIQDALGNPVEWPDDEELQFEFEIVGNPQTALEWSAKVLLPDKDGLWAWESPVPIGDYWGTEVTPAPAPTGYTWTGVKLERLNAPPGTPTPVDKGQNADYGTFVNTYKRDYGNLEFTKSVTGFSGAQGDETWPSDLSIRFQITGPEDFAPANYGLNTDGTFMLDASNRTLELFEVPTGDYTITELTGNYPRYAFAATPSSKILMEVGKDNTASERMTNTYRLIVGDLTFTKDVRGFEGGAWPTWLTLSFTRTGADNQVVPFTLSAANPSISWTDLPMGPYTITESPTDGVTTDSPKAVTVEPGQMASASMINQAVLTSVTVTKNWDDNDNAANTRPATITFTLTRSAGGARDTGFTQSQTLTTAGAQQSHTFEGLQTRDPQGQVYTYDVSELSVPGYTSVKSGSGTSFSFTNTVQLTDVTVTKTWVGDAGYENYRPSGGLAITLSARNLPTFAPVTATIPSANGATWRYTFRDLPMFNANGDRVQYVVTEQALPAYDSAISGMQLTNTLRRIALSVTKRWDDGNNRNQTRPNNITVTLYANGASTGNTVTLSAANGWSQSFGNLPMFGVNGNKINYTIVESGAGNYTGNDGSLSTPSSTAVTSYTFSLRNTLRSKNLRLTKIWEDFDNSEAMMINLFRPTAIRYTLTGTDSRGNVVVNQTGALTKLMNYTATITDLPIYDAYGRYIQYRVTEEGAPNGYVQLAGGQPNSNTEGDMTATLTNRLTPTNVHVRKVWVDTELSAAPEIQVTLRANGAAVKTVRLNQQTGWSYTFENLPRYMANGVTPVVYTVTEARLETFIPTIAADPSTTGYGYAFVITNTPGTPPPERAGNEDLYSTIMDQGVPLAGSVNHKHLGDCFD